MMDAVLAGSVDNVLEWAQVTNHFVVQPNLVDQRELNVHCQDLWGNDQSQRNGEHLEECNYQYATEQRTIAKLTS